MRQSNEQIQVNARKRSFFRSPIAVNSVWGASLGLAAALILLAFAFYAVEQGTRPPKAQPAPATVIGSEAADWLNFG